MESTRILVANLDADELAQSFDRVVSSSRPFALEVSQLALCENRQAECDTAIARAIERLAPNLVVLCISLVRWQPAARIIDHHHNGREVGVNNKVDVC